MPGWVFVSQVLWALALLGVFLAYIHGEDRLDLPHSFGRVPVEAPWLGAVGGLLASLSGIVYYNHGRWEARFNYWHPIKPLMGAASGSAACLLVIIVVRTATGRSTPTIDTTALDGAAFVFGYAESSFRQLIKTVTDVFLKPGTGGSKPQGGGGSGTGGSKPQGGRSGTKAAAGVGGPGAPGAVAGVAGSAPASLTPPGPGAQPGPE